MTESQHGGLGSNSAVIAVPANRQLSTPKREEWYRQGGLLNPAPEDTSESAFNGRKRGDQHDALPLLPPGPLDLLLVSALEPGAQFLNAPAGHQHHQGVFLNLAAYALFSASRAHACIMGYQSLTRKKRRRTRLAVHPTVARARALIEEQAKADPRFRRLVDISSGKLPRPPGWDRKLEVPDSGAIDFPPNLFTDLDVPIGDPVIPEPEMRGKRRKSG